MSNFIKAHGLSIAQNGYIENAVLEQLTTAPATLEAGRLYFDSVAKQVKYITVDGGSTVVKTVGSKEEADSFIASVASATGATLVGTTGTTGANGEFSTTNGTVATNLTSIVTAVDNEIKARKDAVTAEASARTSADTAINATITALKDGSTSTIAELDSKDTDLDNRIADLEEAVSGATGDLATLTTDAKDTIVAAINEVDLHINNEVSRAQSAESNLQDNIDTLENDVNTNFFNKTTTTTQTVVSSVNIAQNLTIDGNLTVKGDNFVTEAEVVTFADNVLTLNSNVTTGEPTENAGLEVLRGDEGTLSIITWNELSGFVTIPVENAEGNFVQDEVVGKTWANSEFVRLEDAIASASSELQSEVDLTQTSAGLNSDGTYSAVLGANYISGATSIKNATQILDTTLKTTNTALATETTARTSADTALDTRLTTVEGQVNGKIGDLEALTTDAKDNLVVAVNEVDAHINTEVTRAQGAEAAISGVIVALKDGSISTIKQLDEKDSLLTTNLNTEVSDRQAAITAEATARTNADSAINSTITSLKDGSTSTIKNLDDAIAAEATRATGAETTINSTISTMKTSINSMYYTFTAETAGTTFNIAHNLNSEFVSVQVWVYDDSTTKWKNDIVAIEIVDNANLTIYLTESRKVKIIVSKIASLS